MAKRKLTNKLKDFLYANRFKVRQSDYEGEALAYLKRLRAASKAAKKRKESTAKINSTTIPKNSELYRLLEDSARLKKQSVAKFIKENKEAIDELIENDRIVMQRETSYAIKDINKLPKRSKIFLNGQQISKGDAVHALQSLTSSAMQHTETVVVTYELSYDLNGNLHLSLPTEDEIEEAEDDPELYGALLEDFPDLIIIKSPPGKKKR
jgi:hypothetical protein